MSTPTKPDKNPLTLYTIAVSTVGQVGCLLGVAIAAALVFGLLLDNLLGTKPLFLFVFLLGSIPLNLWMIYRFTMRKVKALQAASEQEEETARDD
jgi:F0F1-type ATP synthase assembly protein I